MIDLGTVSAETKGPVDYIQNEMGPLPWST